MSVEERIGAAVERARALWAVAMSVAILWIIFTQPLWWLLPLVLVGVVSYFGVLLVTGVLMTIILPHDEVQLAAQEQRLRELGTIENPTPEDILRAGIKVGEIVAVSEVIGRFGEIDIHDWVDIRTGPEKTERFVFEQVTPRDQGGNLLMPAKNGYACLNGLTYKLSST